MKMQPDRLEGTNAVTRLEPGGVWIHQTRFTGSVIVAHRGPVLPWAPRRMKELETQHFAHILSLRPELVILGTGAAQAFPDPALWHVLADASVGFEAMGTAAACRTFNVLASEGRSVVAALLIEPA